MKKELALVEQENVVTARGEVDLANVDRLLRSLRRVRGQHENVIIDLGDVTYMDSSGFGALLRSCRELRHSGGQLVLRRPPAHIRRMLETMDLLRFFTLEEDQAVETLEPSP